MKNLTEKKTLFESEKRRFFFTFLIRLRELRESLGNGAKPSIHGGLFEITLTFPLSRRII